MTLSLCSGSPCLSRFPRSSSLHLSRCCSPSTNTALLSILLCSSSSHCPAAPRHLRDSAAPSPPAVSRRSSFESKASLSESESESSVAGEPPSSSSSSAAAVLSDEVVGEASGAGDADEALRIIAEKAGGRGGVVGVSDCCSITSAALERGNAGLALSVFYAMRATFDQGPGEDGTYVDRWRWSRPDVRSYTLLVQGLAASLRVSDALSVIDIICQVGVSPGVEVPFGKVVRCPSCMIAVAVAQPQDGIQIVSCATCRYKYELFSGDIISIDSEEIRVSSCRTQHGCSSMETGAKISEFNKANYPCCSSLCCGTDPFWCGAHPPVCH